MAKKLKLREPLSSVVVPFPLAASRTTRPTSKMIQIPGTTMWKMVLMDLMGFLFF